MGHTEVGVYSSRPEVRVIAGVGKKVDRWE
jgi:hypothetical protein